MFDLIHNTEMGEEIENNPCRAIIETHGIAKDFQFVVQKYIRRQQPFFGSFKMKVTTALTDNDRRGTIQFSTIYTWVDSWNALAAQATILTYYNIEIWSPDFYRISPPHEDFYHPLKS